MKLTKLAAAMAALTLAGAAYAADTPSSMENSTNPSMNSYSGSQSSSLSTQDQDLVRQVQQNLQSKGFNPGSIDGQWGPRTQAALAKFQKSQGSASSSASLDAQTLVALGVTQGASASMGTDTSSTTSSSSSTHASPTTPGSTATPNTTASPGSTTSPSSTTSQGSPNQNQGNTANIANIKNLNDLSPPSSSTNTTPSGASR